MTEEINEEELPNAGNSDAKLYPPVEEAESAPDDDDPQQAEHGDAAAVREGGPEADDAA